MAYPIWITPGGDLGKISSQDWFDLDLMAYDINDQSIFFTLVAGQLPSGLALDPQGKVAGKPKNDIILEGVPAKVNKDVTSYFTIRVENQDGQITDRSFYITVTGNHKPMLLNDTQLLGIYLDGTPVSIQLTSVDLDNDPLTWSVISGNLPPGLTLDQNGLISGILIPYVLPTSLAEPGWDNSAWDLYNWELTTKSASFNYPFTVSLTDGKSTDTHSYLIQVYAHDTITADNTFITVDNTGITADHDTNRPPLLLTTSLGPYAIAQSDNFYAFRFVGIDYDQVPVKYSLLAAAGAGWDADGTSWDSDLWDRGNFELAPGLVLDENTGWLTGYIPPQTYASQTYTFGVQVYNSFDETIISPIYQFNITILGATNLQVTWNTPTDLGTVDTGVNCEKYISATAASGRELTYSLSHVTGFQSKLPQGLQLLSDGTISGRPSFQTFTLDGGTTTFDVVNLERKFQLTKTTIDNKYTFTVIANDSSNTVTSQKTFTLSVNSNTHIPFENIYLRCTPSAAKRLSIESILQNTDIFDPIDVYRPQDPFWGVQPDITFLVASGLTPSDAATYIEVMQDRHYTKKFFFGDYKTAKAKDKDGNYIYDVVYVDLIEDTKSYVTQNGVTKKLYPSPSTVMPDKIANWHNSTDPSKITVRPNDLTLMQKDLNNRIVSFSNYDTTQSLWVLKDGYITLKATGLPDHSYGNPNSPNPPKSQSYNITFPLRGGNNIAGQNVSVGYENIGFWLNGVAIFSHATQDVPSGFIAIDGYDYNSSYAMSQSLGYSFNEDLAGGRATINGAYHYNDYSFASVWLNGVGATDYSVGKPETTAISYLNSGLTHPNGHSKIIGWALDGYPIYGPYGYTNPLASGAVKRVETSYTIKDSSYRTGAATDLVTYPMGIFVQDFEYTEAGDLDEHNGRYCVTPDFPNGTYAYFVTIDSTNTPVYPYVIGNTFYSIPAQFTTGSAIEPGIAPVTYTLKILGNGPQVTFDTLPEWMTTVQSDGKILGYTSAAVLAYMKPTLGPKALFNLKRLTPADIRTIPFVTDRYIWDNNLTTNFNINTQKFVSHAYTKFDSALHYATTLSIVATVDIAVDIPFDQLYGTTVDAIYAAGGLDGQILDYDGRTIVFAKQELFDVTKYPNLTNDGWNLGNTIVPGYTEKNLGQSLVNQRGGIWKIHVDAVNNNTISLEFIQEINASDNIFVTYGSKYGNNYLRYDISVIGTGLQTVPAYTIQRSNIIKPTNETIFDGGTTRFINNEDIYQLPLENDKYLKFPKVGVF